MRGLVWMGMTCIIGVASATSCGAGSDRAATVEVLDSAGVRIVVNPEAPPVRLRLTEDPVLEVGTVATDTVILYGVEGGVFAPGGGIVVANGGNHEVLYFTADGALERRVGREGDGPGEFRDVTWMEGRADGGVVLGDARTRRVTALGARGEPLWSRRFDPAFDDGGLPSNAITASGLAISGFDEGHLIGYPRAIALPRGSRGPLPLQGDFAVYRADTAETAEPLPLGRHTVMNWYEEPGREGFPIANALGNARIWWGGHSGRLALTESIEARIEVFDRGRHTLVVRERRSRRPFEPDSVPMGYDFAVDSVPAYHDLRVDGLHRIWALLTSDEDPSTWRVFDATGVMIADVELPADARLLDADEARLLLLRRDELDVESISVYPFGWPDG